MKRMLRIVSWAAAPFLLAGCGGGGGDRAATQTTIPGDNGRPPLVAGQAVSTRTGTVRFNLFPVTVMAVVGEDGVIYTPVNPPDNAFDGERVRFSFVPAQNPPVVRETGQPIELLSFAPV